MPAAAPAAAALASATSEEPLEVSIYAPDLARAYSTGFAGET